MRCFFFKVHVKRHQTDVSKPEPDLRHAFNQFHRLAQCWKTIVRNGELKNESIPFFHFKHVRFGSSRLLSLSLSLPLLRNNAWSPRCSSFLSKTRRNPLFKPAFPFFIIQNLFHIRPFSSFFSSSILQNHAFKVELWGVPIFGRLGRLALVFFFAI